MYDANTPISAVMTPDPHCVRSGDSLAMVRSRLNELGVRHMPVTAGTRVVGMISARDLVTLSLLDDADFAKLKVNLVMAHDLYQVRPDAPLRDVVLEMGERHIGSALVTDKQGKLLGIFTASDAVRTLGRLLMRAVPGPSAATRN